MIFFASERKTNYFFGRSPKNHIFARYLTKLQAYDSSNFRYSNSVAHYTDDGLQSIYFIGPETPAILGSVAAIIAMLIYNKLFIRKESDAEKVIVEKQKFGLVNMEGQDGEIMRKTIPFAIFWILMNGLMVFLGLHVI